MNNVGAGAGKDAGDRGDVLGMLRTGGPNIPITARREALLYSYAMSAGELATLTTI